MDQEVYSIIAEYRKRVEAHGVTVKKIILYGSYAEGNAREHSDIDLAVVSDDFIGMGQFETLRLLGRARAGMGVPMEIIGLTEDEYERPPTSFIRDEVKAKGIEVE